MYNIQFDNKRIENLLSDVSGKIEATKNKLTFNNS